MGLFRSEEMRSGTLVLPMEGAKHFVDMLGAATFLEFDDMHARSAIPHRP
jgi:hypothetical protein